MVPECSNCKAAIPPYANTCPECGTPVGEPDFASSSTSSDEDAVHALLLHAHLLKIRGNADAAVAECIKALRINPDSIESHTLLGDIYKSQGKMDEASHWYKLALDINPNNPSNQSKLEQLGQDEHHVGDGTEGANASDDSVGKRKQLISMLAGAGVVLLIAVLLFAIPRHKGRTGGHPSQGTTSTAYAPTVTPNLDARVQEIPGTMPGTSTEMSLLNTLNSSSTLTNFQLRVTSVAMDPRSSAAVLTVIVPYIDGEDMSHVLIQGSLIIARECFRADDSLTLVTMRAMSTLPTSNDTNPELYFIGDVAKEKAYALDLDAAGYSDKLAVFTNVWWHRYLRQE